MITQVYGYSCNPRCATVDFGPGLPTADPTSLADTPPHQAERQRESVRWLAHPLPL